MLFPDISEFASPEEAFFWLGATAGNKYSLEKLENMFNLKVKWKEKAINDCRDTVSDILTELIEESIEKILVKQNTPQELLKNVSFVVFDTETTGTSRFDTVCQMCFLACNFQ